MAAGNIGAALGLKITSSGDTLVDGKAKQVRAARALVCLLASAASRVCRAVPCRAVPWEPDSDHSNTRACDGVFNVSFPPEIIHSASSWLAWMCRGPSSSVRLSPSHRRIRSPSKTLSPCS